MIRFSDLWSGFTVIQCYVTLGGGGVLRPVIFIRHSYAAHCYRNSKLMTNDNNTSYKCNISYLSSEHLYIAYCE